MKIRSPITFRESTTTSEPKPQTKKEKIYNGLGGLLDLSQTGLSGEKSISTKLLKANEGWVYRNNDVIAQEVSKIEFELYTMGLSGGQIVYNEVTSHPLLDLLDKPNDETEKSYMMYLIQSHKKLTGDAFLLKIRNGQQVVALRQLPPDKIKLDLQAPTADDPTVIKAYVYDDTIDGNKVHQVYDPKDIVHLKKPNPNNPFRGLGAVEALKDTIDLDNLTTETAKRFYLNGAIMNMALSTDSKVTDEQIKRLQAQFRQSFTGTKNAFKVPILGGGLEPKDISYSNKEQDLIKQLEWYRDKIMVGFGNTKASLGLVDDVNRASFDGSYASWLKSTVKPDMEAIVNALNEFLVPEFGTNLVLGFCDPVPEDRAEDVNEADKLYRAGLVTRDEARDMVDLDPSGDGGDEFYSNPTAVAPIGVDNAPTE